MPKIFFLVAFATAAAAAAELPALNPHPRLFVDGGTFASLKGGKATSPHGHMDGGSFVYDAKGVRWAWDLGADNYATIEHHIGMELWNYTEGSGRYRVFRLSAAAHNTLMLDGLPHCATGSRSVVYGGRELAGEP